jgi:hypothetical protein
MKTSDVPLLRAAALYRRIRSVDPEAKLVVLGYPEPRVVEIHILGEATGTRIPVEVIEDRTLPFTHPDRVRRMTDPVALAATLAHLLWMAWGEIRPKCANCGGNGYEDNASVFDTCALCEGSGYARTWNDPKGTDRWNRSN